VSQQQEAEPGDADREEGTPSREMYAEQSPQQERMAEKTRKASEAAEERERKAEEGIETASIKVFRYDPEVEGKQEPRFDEFRVPFEKGMTVLDALMYARDHYDSSLTFRHSCRQAICGSDAFFINGRQRLGCKTQIQALEEPVRVEPLPHMDVVKDLVVEMEDFYEQMEAVEPYFQDEDTPPIEDLEEQRQSPENHEEVKMSTRCIWCGACTSSCNIAADSMYLGPASVNKAYKFIMDEREDDPEITQHRMEIMESERGVWRCQTQFSCTEVCPKDIPLTEHIQELKREAVKRNLKFW